MSFEWSYKTVQREPLEFETSNIQRTVGWAELYKVDALTVRETQMNSTAYTALENIVTFIQKEVLQYLETNIKTELLNNLNGKINGMPIIFTGLKTNMITVSVRNYQYVRHCSRRWGKRRRTSHWHSGNPSVVDGYSYVENINYNSAIARYIKTCTAMQSDINRYIRNNCENQNSLLNTNGLKTCGIYDKIEKFRYEIKPIKDKSNYVMTQIKNTEDYPQYSQAKEIDDTINKWYNWDPMDTPVNLDSSYFSTDNDNKPYASDTIAQIEAYIGNSPDSVKNILLTNYDYCVSNDTHIGIDNDNVPVCPEVKNDYIKSAQRCGQAIQMSKTYEYGTDKLTDLWTDVSNSIPGNMKRESSLILNTGNDSCKKWVDMFSIWEEKEEEALATPCNPERPIASTNNDTLIKMADDWNKSAASQIAQLKARLLKIQKYIKNYPNILYLEEKSITLAPSSMTATALIKKNFSETNDGESPKQHLEMIIPNGVPGKQGKMGTSGMVGPPGKRGIDGPMGNMGNVNIPYFFNKNK